MTKKFTWPASISDQHVVKVSLALEEFLHPADPHSTDVATRRRHSCFYLSSQLLLAQQQQHHHHHLFAHRRADGPAGMRSNSTSMKKSCAPLLR